MQVVQASTDDAEGILSLQKLAYLTEAEFYNNYDIAPLKQTLDEVREQLKTQVVLKAVSEGEIVGSVRAYEKDGTCYVGKLMVHPKRQNQGIGAALMKKIEGYFQPKRFELFTGAKSKKNIYLYEKLGYSIFKKEQDGSGMEMVYMERKNS